MAKGIRAFEALLKKVVAVPKEKVEARMAKTRAKRIAKRAQSTDDPQKK